MKRSAIFLLFIFLAGQSFSEDNAQEIVRKLYQEHRPGQDHSILSNFQALSKYFDEEMISLLKKDQECSERTGELCKLSYDPIYNGQEFSDEPLNLRLEPKLSSASAARFKVLFNNYGPVTLTYQLKKTARGWRISDIIDEEGHSLKEMLGQPVE